MNTQAADQIAAVYALATGFSREARGLIAEQSSEFVVSEPPGCGDIWSQAIHRRIEDGRAHAVATHARRLVACAAPAERAAVRAVVRELRRAVELLARYRAELESVDVVLSARIANWLGMSRNRVTTYYTPTAAAVEELNTLRSACRVRLIEVEEAFRDHPTGMDRYLAAATRAAHVLLEGEDAELMADTCSALATGQAA